VHSTVQLAERLRKDYPSGVSVATFQNRQGDKAREHVLRLLDIDQDGTLSGAKSKNARIIIYGHSWGASQDRYLGPAIGKRRHSCAAHHPGG